MRLEKARVQNYRSIRDTGEFAVEKLKTIMVGPNEAGKSAILQALQQLCPPKGAKKFDALRDYPRALYNDITTKRVLPGTIPVVTGVFILDEDDLEVIPEKWRSTDCRYIITRRLDNTHTHLITGAPAIPNYGDLQADLMRLVAHLDREDTEARRYATELDALVKDWTVGKPMHGADTEQLRAWLLKNLAVVDEGNEREVERHTSLSTRLNDVVEYTVAANKLYDWLPVFVLFSNYFRVRPNLHLGHLADRLETGVLDDEQYDYGNSCLLKLLGFKARELSKLGSTAEPSAGGTAEWEAYRAQLDKRGYQLDAASLALSREITKVWNPDEGKGEASRLKVTADGQYLKVVVEDGIGVSIELDQRSEGFQWLVSFFVVFFAERSDQHHNTILLLDEPGVSLHALKQREFRLTLSRLADDNQTIFTTHSPFMVGPDELDLVRVVELTDRNIGTKVHTSITSSDPAALLPLQEALGYDMAQSLFMQQRNLVLEGLTDLFYLEASADLLKAADLAELDARIALIPSNTASKVVYFATILHAQGLKVAALLDSDSAGDRAATQEVLVHRLGNKRILRTKDFVQPGVPNAEIEDLLRGTLIEIAKAEFNWDISAEAAKDPTLPVVDVFNRVVGKEIFSKYKLAKAFIRWTRGHTADDLSAEERDNLGRLIVAINGSLK